MIIKRVVETDVESVFALYTSNTIYFNYAHNPQVTREDVRNDMRNKPSGTRDDQKHYLKIVEDDGIVGVIDIITDYPEKGTGFIGLFMVDGERHSKGYGERGFQLLKEWLESYNIYKLQLGVIAENKEALGFWNSLGFRIISERLIMMNDVETLIYIMRFENQT